MATENTVRRLAMAMPNVEERTSYGTPAFYVKRKLFARMLDDRNSVVIKIDEVDREARMKADPDAFFITDHYLNYPMMIVRLSKVDSDVLCELLDDAWQYAVK